MSGRTAPNRPLFPAWSRYAPVVAASVTAGVPLLAYLLTMPPTITWWFGGSDSGDLVSAADALGVPHPTGYPLFVLLGHVATRVPVGEAAGRINAMNALLASLGAVGILLAVRALAPRIDAVGEPGARRPPGAATWLPALAAMAVAGSSLYWSQAIIGEVYALHAALTALVLWLWASPGTHPAWRGAAHGLSLTNHVTSAALLVAAVVGFARVRGGAGGQAGRPARADTARRAAWFVAGLVAPLMLYALLPLRAAQEPIANWGDPSTPGRFLHHVSGRDYRGLVDWRDPARVLRDLPALVRFMVGDLCPWVLPAALAGLLRLWRGDRQYAVFTGATLGGTLLFTALYRVPDRVPYLLPAYVVLGVWAGAGLLVAAESLAQWAAAGAEARRRVAGRAAGAVLVLLLAGWTLRTGARVNLRGDDSAVVFARATLLAVPEGATYYSARDDVTFALWYAQRSLGIRRDVRVVDIRAPQLRGVP